MSSKAEKRRRRKKARTEAQSPVAGSGSQNRDLTPSALPDRPNNRPTAERMARGAWAMPQGAQKSRQPVVDAASDMVGWLLVSKKITHSQEQAARHFQELRGRYMDELPEISGYKSCLAGSVPGFDDGDGDAAVIAEYRRIERKLTIPQRREVLRVCDMGEKPANIELLRSALDKMSGK